MKRVVFLGSDHAGFELKQKLTDWLSTLAIILVDLSPTRSPGDDYPLIATRLAQHVAKTPDARGILVCGSGVGVTIAANRVKKIRAFEAFDAETTKLARQDNDANVLALSGWRQTPDQARQLIQLFLKTNASKAERHQRRIKQLG